MAPRSTLPKLDRPPVTEVVLGVAFKDLPIQVAHIGLFWQMVRDEFPNIEERPPLGLIIEGEIGNQPQMQLELLQSPPLPRTWMISRDGSTLLQVQRDRFHFNWKRETTDNQYPSYDFISERFEQFFKRFCAFVLKEGLGEVNFTQYEITYINHLDLLDDTYDVFVDHRRVRGKRFLPAPEYVSWRTTYPLPDRAGRLHVNIQTALRTSGQKIIQVDLTARGISQSGLTDVDRLRWFKTSHDFLIRAFADVTDPKIQKSIWKRTQ